MPCTPFFKTCTNNSNVVKSGRRQSLTLAKRMTIKNSGHVWDIAICTFYLPIKSLLATVFPPDPSALTCVEFSISMILCFSPIDREIFRIRFCSYIIADSDTALSVQGILMLHTRFITRRHSHNFKHAVTHRPALRVCSRVNSAIGYSNYQFSLEFVVYH